MTPRSIRRAAQRHADKLARRANKLAEKAVLPDMPAAEVEAAAETPAAPQPTIVTAAEANANLSAITSTLTGCATLIPTADAAQYSHLLRAYEDEFQPVGLQESNLVQTLAESAWRARRMVALESAIFAKGRIEFAAQFAQHDPGVRESLIDVHTFLTYEKQIRSLQLQEARLTRRADKASAELRSLQQERRTREEAIPQGQSQAGVELKSIGFVFSNPGIEPHPVQKHSAEISASNALWHARE